MTVGKLKDRLEMWPDETKVILGTQPEYPFFNTIERLRDYTATDEDPNLKEGEMYVVILEGSQLGYGDRSLW